MADDHQGKPIRMVRLTASSLLGFWVVLTPATFDGSENSAKRPAQAVASRVPGPAASRDVRLSAAGVATPTVRKRSEGTRVAGVQIPGTPIIGSRVAEDAKPPFDKVEIANGWLAAHAEQFDVARSIPMRSSIKISTTWPASPKEASPPKSSATRSAGARDKGAPAPMRIPSGLDHRAAAAVRAAYAQLGTPYVWGGVGRGGFDCSGLTQHVWRIAGVTIPRTSSGQARSGTRVRLSDIKPGDLVVYYGSQSHVGIYVGGGKIIHAPHPGTSVQIGSVTGMPISAVVRY